MAVHKPPRIGSSALSGLSGKPALQLDPESVSSSADADPRSADEPQPFFLKEPIIAYSISELADATSLSRSLIYLHIKTGALKITKVGNRTIILPPDAKNWLWTLRGNK